MRFFVKGLIAASIVLALIVGGLWAYAGGYGFSVLLRHGGFFWTSVKPDSPQLSPSMRLALGAAPIASPGAFQWQTIAEGFEAADLPVLAGSETVDHILLARIDPRRFRFVVRTAPAGTKGLDRWMVDLGAALVVNGSYYARDGKPSTPALSDGRMLGPAQYDARAGAFVASSGFTGIRDLQHQDWKAAFQGADNAMVSFPLLMSGGVAHSVRSSRWLANRSFVGEDGRGWIVIGTTSDAFFPLDRLAHFLQDAPLDLVMALNLDGGPVASQAISLNGYDRKTYGRWEAQVEGDKVQLLTWPYGSPALPVVLAVLPR